ncbi:MAG: glycine--tRNA ligase [Prevotellaceae bacterium]|jgi:glycyl-tRNA synthetase|nr:glycine--tRNA ligase [Prevotellaceae bacterium]
MTQEELFKKLIAHCKEYGYIFPSSEIYDGLGAVYDYGQNGVELKNNIKRYWWEAMVKLHENIVGIDSAIFMHPKIWEASGHVGAFNDPLIDNKDSKKRYRADVLIEEYIAKLEEKVEKEVAKGKKKFGDTFDETQFRSTNPNVLRNVEKIEEVRNKMKIALNSGDLNRLRDIIIDCEIACPISGTRNWTEVRQFNLMFSTQMGSVSNDTNLIYLRPETAQGIFVNFLNVQKTGRMKIPFGIAQIGKAFRNEIVARQFIFRMREFEQMEMQFFVRPGEEMKWYEYWKNIRMEWHRSLGFGNDKYRFHDHDKLAHYANAAADVEFNFPFGFKEVEGIHSRTDFDLGNHQKFSGKKIQYFDPDTNESFVPYVVETSIGVDRTVLLVLSAAYAEETVAKDNGETDERVVLRIPPILAPVKFAVLPLVKKDGLPEKAKEIMNTLKFEYKGQYDEKDTIGRRYRRQDAIGTPFCITVDNRTLEDDTVTIRYRDTMAQERVPVTSLSQVLDKLINMKYALQDLELKTNKYK